MVHFISPRLLGFLGLVLSTVSPAAHGDHDARDGLTCGLGHSFEFDFCYDGDALTPALPMAGFAYVLTTADRGQFITVSVTQSDAAPNLDLPTLQESAKDASDLPLGSAYVFSSLITLNEGDENAYTAELDGPGDFGFRVQAIRTGSVPGGVVRVSLIDTRFGETDTNPEALEAFAQITSTFRLL